MPLARLDFGGTCGLQQLLECAHRRRRAIGIEPHRQTARSNPLGSQPVPRPPNWLKPLKPVRERPRLPSLNLILLLGRRTVPSPPVSATPATGPPRSRRRSSAGVSKLLHHFRERSAQEAPGLIARPAGVDEYGEPSHDARAPRARPCTFDQLDRATVNAAHAAGRDSSERASRRNMSALKTKPCSRQVAMFFSDPAIPRPRGLGSDV